MQRSLSRAKVKTYNCHKKDTVGSYKSVEIRFDKISKVVKDVGDPKLYGAFSGRNGAIKSIELSLTPGMDDRWFQVVKFLKEKCDPASDTGF